MIKGTFSLLAAGLLLVACDSTSAPRPPVSYAPEVTLNSDPVTDPQRVDLRATVTARDAVERVAFYRDGKLLGEDREAPYTWTDRIEDGVTYTYQAYAYDVAGRRGVSDYYDVRQSPALESVSGQLYDFTSLTAPAEVKPWSGGAGTAELLAGGQSVQKAPLAADGTFTFDLKQKAPQSGWLPATPQSLLTLPGLSGCQGTASSSDPAARLVLGQVKVSAGKSGDAAPLKVLPPTQAGNAQLNYFSLGTLVYADRAVSLTGRLTCPAGQSRTVVDFQLPLQKGWNKVTQQITKPSGAALPSQISFASNFPQPEQWVLVPQLP
ncbi:Ig-like domain-containing protein [Deinococcus wulumuqiensis]|uniref:Uncharacterized protein n=1 Tax=Deinococcus wulumuqiensis TaxID=980427 RepID=A0AAV4K4G4_9DEIO|nr:Ig-like domain-containing protein [Deinococcus wulumuqiensis]QII19484.1 hypothetical protein G6R31_00960 [Deinococcus wulumuqiensis R12]GGI76267.1 hypothetical protein GCM10010914_08140 [Deinococcus wulumuqiensis]GGP29216.1 hypothetical protein GCM10008021_08670 [Deinococcus wulumuqiensis]